MWPGLRPTSMFVQCLVNTGLYAVLECLLSRFWEGSRAMRPYMAAYDSWSVGVVWLELLLGEWAAPGPGSRGALHLRHIGI